HDATNDDWSYYYSVWGFNDLSSPPSVIQIQYYPAHGFLSQWICMRLIPELTAAYHNDTDLMGVDVYDNVAGIISFTSFPAIPTSAQCPNRITMITFVFAWKG